MYLSDDHFQHVISSAPLISIDLIVEQNGEKILLGKRINRPAKGYWFVPGGRVQKNERLDDAFFRITRAELGISYERGNATFLGVFEHFYSDSMFSDFVDTHYLALAYRFSMDAIRELPLTQHEHFSWWSIVDICESDSVHPNTQTYGRFLL
ncbi:GDP-mannose mannosyl hydrolase [Bordetella tumulicola]|uniref:GDP-mannose mannosyl hydrolase n=1 Tax=Bordetella tumulicola TaxID=1649133 RepID=UPI0039F005A8